MKHSFSIFHISDLHERGPRERERARRERVLGDAWLNNLDELRAEGVDLVCMTGDLAQSGKVDEYDGAGLFLERTLGRLGLARDRLFVVPGNHDIDRSRSANAWQALRTNIHRADALDVSRWISGGRVPLGMETAWRNGVLRRQEAFRAWLKGFGLASLLPGSSPHGRLGYSRRVRLPDLPYDIYVVGLDSAWLAGSDDDAGKLRLTDAQVHKLCRDEGGQLLAGFRLVLIHHPLTELFDGSDCRRLLGDSTDLLLRGHLHAAEPEVWADPDRRLRQFAAGCLFEGHRADRHPNGCTLLKVTCDAAGRPLRYDLRFRSFSPRGGHWHDDDSLYRGTQHGRLSIVLTNDDNRQASKLQSFPVNKPMPMDMNQKQQNGSITKQSQHVGPIQIQGDGNTVIIQQTAHGTSLAPPSPGDAREADSTGTAACPTTETDAEQQYFQNLRDHCIRTSPVEIFEWQHSRRMPQGASRLELFVPQRLRRVKHDPGLSSGNIRAQPTQREQTADLASSDEYSPEQALSQRPISLFLGAPGAGKSELIRWLALRLGPDYDASQGFPSDHVPILIELRDLDDELSRQGSALGGILGYVTKRFSAMGLAIADRISNLAEQGRLFLLCDGMDEVRQAARRAHLAEMIRTFYRTRRCRVMVTSRLALEAELVRCLSPAPSPHLEEDRASEFAAYYIEPFNDHQISQYIGKWHQQTLALDPAALAERKNRLHRSIEENRTLHELATNPLLLWLLCALNHKGELPRRRHLVLKEASELMIHRWDAKKQLTRSPTESSITDDDKRRFLESLAWEMQSGRFRDGGANRIRRDDLFRFTVTFWRHLPLESDELERRANMLLRDLELHDHLLTHLGLDLFGFMHKSFLEFLAARYASRHHVEIDLPAVFRKNGFEESWIEVFTLCCGLLDDQDKALVIKECLQELLRQVPLSFRDRHLRMAYAAVAIRCLAEVNNLEAEPYRSLADLVRHMIQRDSLAIMHRGFGAWRDKEVVTALRYFGPRWPSLDEWCDWALQPDWRREGGFDTWRRWAVQCVLAATPLSRRVETLQRLLQTEEDLHVITGALEEASLLGPWQEEEVVRLAQSNNEELLVRVGLELAKAGKPIVLTALLRRPVADWICLYIARDNCSSTDEDLWEAAWHSLFRLTMSPVSRIRGYAVRWVAPAVRDPVVCQQFLHLARNDSDERVRFDAAEALLGTSDRNVGMETITNLADTQDPVMLDWLAATLRDDPTQIERRRGLLMRMINGDSSYHRSRAAIELARGFLEMPEVEDRLVEYLESNAREMHFGDGMPPTILRNQRVFETFLRSLFAADYYDGFNHGLLALTDINKNMDSVTVIAERLQAALQSKIPEKARLFVVMWFRHHGVEGIEPSTHLRCLSENAQDDDVRVQAAELLDVQGSAQLHSLVVHSADQNIRNRAIWALVRHVATPKVREWLIDLAQSSTDSRVRIRAAMAMFHVSDDVAVREAGGEILASLAGAYDIDEEVRSEAAEELVNRPVLSHLAETATNQNIRLRAQDSVEILKLHDQLLAL